MTSRMKAFGKMVISPFVKIKGNAVAQINRMYQQMLRLGSMVIAPVVKLKDQALSKLKSSIKLFQNLGKKSNRTSHQIKGQGDSETESYQQYAWKHCSQNS